MWLDLPLRDNLSLDGRHSDEEIWKALDLCGLRNLIEKLPGRLDAIVKTFSRGQVRI